MPGTVYGDHMVEGGQGHPDTRLIAHDDTEELGNLLWLADTVLGKHCQKMDCSLPKRVGRCPNTHRFGVCTRRP